MIDIQTFENSECCKIPKTNREFWVAKIRRNKERDKEDQKRLAAMGWHCITVWECELKPSKREETLNAIAFTLNHIFLQDHSLPKPYQPIEEEGDMSIAAEDRA
jgi:DNA mismatch endonuclease (patch repair protein)